MPVTIDGNSYSYYRPISNTGHRPSSALTNYPLKVGIVADSTIGARCKADGSDLRFTLSDDTLLYAEKDGFSVTDGAATGVFWVNVPSVASASDLALRCYYGNADATAQTSPSSTWNSDYCATYRMTDASKTAFNDSTANGRNATKGAANKPVDAAGLINRCQSFNGTDASATTASYSSAFSRSATISCWVKTARMNLQRMFTFSKGQGTNFMIASGRAADGSDANDGKPLGSYRNSSGTFCICKGAAAISDDAWHHLAWVVDGANGVLYVDGASAATVSDIDSAKTFPAAPWDSIATIGKNLATAEYYSGLMDELRVSSAAHSAAWIAYDYGTQLDNTYLTWGDEVAVGAAAAYRLYSFPRRGDLLAKGR